MTGEGGGLAFIQRGDTTWTLQEKLLEFCDLSMPFCNCHYDHSLMQGMMRSLHPPRLAPRLGMYQRWAFQDGSGRPLSKVNLTPKKSTLLWCKDGQQWYLQICSSIWKPIWLWRWRSVHSWARLAAACHSLQRQAWLPPRKALSPGFPGHGLQIAFSPSWLRCCFSVSPCCSSRPVVLALPKVSL